MAVLALLIEPDDLRSVVVGSRIVVAQCERVFSLLQNEGELELFPQFLEPVLGFVGVVEAGRHGISAHSCEIWLDGREQIVLDGHVEHIFRGDVAVMNIGHLEDFECPVRVELKLFARFSITGQDQK